MPGGAAAGLSAPSASLGSALPLHPLSGQGGWCCVP